MIDSSKLESSIEKHFTVLSLRIQSQIPRQPENFQFRFLPGAYPRIPCRCFDRRIPHPLNALPGTILKTIPKNDSRNKSPSLNLRVSLEKLGSKPLLVGTTFAKNKIKISRPQHEETQRACIVSIPEGSIQFLIILL